MSVIGMRDPRPIAASKGNSAKRGIHGVYKVDCPNFRCALLRDPRGVTGATLRATNLCAH